MSICTDLFVRSSVPKTSYFNMNVIPPYSRSSNYEVLGQAYLSSRSLTQGLDVINMEPSAPAVRTSVINSYLSNSAPQIQANASQGSNALVSTVASDLYSLSPYGGTSSLGAATAVANTAVARQADLTAQNAEVFSPKIYAVIKNTITQALNDQITSGQGSGHNSNINALISDQSSPGLLANSTAAQINSFVNTLVYTVQSETNLSTTLSFPALGAQNANLAQGVRGNAQSVSTTLAESQFGLTDPSTKSLNQTGPSTNLAPSALINSSSSAGADFLRAQPYPSSSVADPFGAPHSTSSASPSNSEPLTTEAQGASQNILNPQGWVIDRISSSVQSMIDNLAMNQAQNAGLSQSGGANNTVAALDSLIQSANSLFTSMGLSSTVTASTLQSALQEIQRNLMSAPSQGQWVNVVA